MKKALQLLTLSVAGLTGAHAAPPPANSAAPDRILLINSSSTPVAEGKATLIIGALETAYHFVDECPAGLSRKIL